MKPGYGNGAIVIEIALEKACQRIMNVCLDNKCPVICKKCMTGVPTRESCAMRLKKYFLRRVR